MSLRPREIAFEEVWTKLYDIIKGVITLNRLRRIDKPLWHNTFSDVYMLCVAHPEPHSKQLYEETRRLLELHVIAIYDVSRAFHKFKKCHHSLNPRNIYIPKILIENSDEKLLNLYFQYWNEFSKGSEYLNNLFM
jgi:cullin 2